MDPLLKEIDTVVRENFPGAVTELQLVDGRAWGFVLWKKFQDIREGERVSRLHDVLRQHFGRNHRKKLSTILPFTPWEMKIMREEQARPQNY